MEGIVLGYIEKELESSLIIYLEPRGECGIYKINSKADFIGIDIFDEIRFVADKQQLNRVEKIGFVGLKNIIRSMKFSNQPLKFISRKIDKRMIILVEKSQYIHKKGNEYKLEFDYNGNVECCKLCDIEIRKYLKVSDKNIGILNEYINNSHTILVLEEREGYNEIVKIQNIKMEIYK